jgi:DNA-binding transcriptional ArsR family regulator
MRGHRLNGDFDLARVGSLIGDEARAAMLLALGTGRARSASDLALVACITPQTASSHLAKLVAGGLLTVRRDGRGRWYKIATPAVSAALEALGRIAPMKAPNALSESDKSVALRRARTCYDHLAGRLGVDVFDALVERAALRDVETRPVPKRRSGLGTVTLGPKAEAVFAELGVDLALARESPRQFATACLDWTEDAPHLAGALGAALCNALFARGWIRHRRNDRALVITEAGVRGLRERFAVDVAAPRERVL